MTEVPSGGPASFNLADVWEAVLPHVGDRLALVCGDRHLTYAELADRVDRLAAVLTDRGVGPGDMVGVHLVNGTEYLEAMLAAWKLRAVPVNVNFRYQAGELVHLYTDAELVGVVHQRSFAPRILAIRDEVPDVGWFLAVDEPAGAGAHAGDAGEDEVVDALAALGSVPYEAALASATPRAAYPDRSGDDLYVIYTGGTTGLPKGVVWRQEDAFFACIGGGDPMRLDGPVSSPGEVLDRIVGGPFVFFPVAPLMHAAGQWTALSWLLAGGTVVLLPGSLDPHEVWRTVGREGVNVMAVVGDPVVRPLLDAWDEAGGYDVPSLISVGSGGAPLSPVLKDRFMAALPDVGLVDGYGSSETGAQGSQRLEPGDAPGGVTAFTPYASDTVVLDEATRAAVEPGSGAVGRVALRGHIPLRYHNDPDKTAATFVEVGGHRWVLTGDMATVEADGTITLLGRGSACINTGGEKVYPEEVESVLKAHPDVYDVIVVGVPDERWGQAVAAVVQPVPGASPQGEALAAHVRASLAGYKVPRQVVLVDEVQRSPAGKPDHRWARATAEVGTAPGPDAGAE